MDRTGKNEVVSRAIVVAGRPEAAFHNWTARMDSWWPKGHSMSGNPATTVYCEGDLGGRIYEITPDGVEMVWGRIIAWSPPGHYAFDWYLGSGPEQPTRVDVTFTADGDGQTRVRVEHRGPELIGPLWQQNSPRYDRAWEHILETFGRVDRPHG